jgi:hypothetical protein
MALAIPIISSFDGKGIKKAISQFKQLETTGDKVSFALKKGAQAAGIALAGIGVAAGAVAGFLFSATKAAMEDAKSQRELAASIKSVTQASAPQLKAVEAYIDATQRAYGISDDKLRPALARIVRSTKDVAKAQSVLTTAIRISTATGKPLETVANALSKSYDGQNTALNKLGLGFDKAELKTKSFTQIQKELDDRFKGAASDAANSFEGKVARLKITFDELKESAGKKIIPILEKVADAGLRISDAFGLSGAAGGLRQLRAELETVLYDADGKLNTAGKTLRSLISVANLQNRFFQSTGAILGTAKNYATGNFDYKATVNPESIQNFPSQITPRAMQEKMNTKPTVIIQTGVGDPIAIGKEVQRILKSYERRTGNSLASVP